jgi:hypothetical protein
MDLTEILWDDLTDGTRDRFMHKAKACIEAAIASGDLVPASAGQPGEKPINKIVDGAKEALAVARGEQPATRIYMQGHAYVPASAVAEMRDWCARVAEKTDPVTDEPKWHGQNIAGIIRQLDLAPACGDYMVAKPALLEHILDQKRRYQTVNLSFEQADIVIALIENAVDRVVTTMLHASSSNGGRK